MAFGQQHPHTEFFDEELAEAAPRADDLEFQPDRRHLRLADLPQSRGRKKADNIEVNGSHCGLGHHPAAVYAMADRVAQPEGAWMKLDPHDGLSARSPSPTRGASKTSTGL